MTQSHQGYIQDAGAVLASGHFEAVATVRTTTAAPLRPLATPRPAASQTR